MRAFYIVIKALLALDINVQEQIYRYMYKKIKLQYSSQINVHDVSILFPENQKCHRLVQVTLKLTSMTDYWKPNSLYTQAHIKINQNSDIKLL